MTAPTPERREGEAEVFVPRMPSSVVQDEINYCAHKLDRTFRDEVDLRTYLYICQDWRDLRAANTRLTAEVERLREFAERMISPCEWGPYAFIEENEADISDWAVSCGILVERVHTQPCEVEGCECDGSPTLLHFAWSPEVAALSLPTPGAATAPPEATE